MRLYNENGREGFSKSKVEVPTGCALFKNEIMLPPKVWAEEIYNDVIMSDPLGDYISVRSNLQMERMIQQQYE